VPATRPIVFLGSSLSLQSARAVLDADFRPPAAQGDMLAAAMEGPPAIGLIDGTFDRVPAVWHKEILWALSQGIGVYGAASMGALRAAELDEFGMRGVGQVYSAYRDGTLEDDDEVAVAHAGADEGWHPLSDAMVDVRECLVRARRAGVVADDTAAEVADRVKETFYPLRKLDAALDARRADHRRLQAWLEVNRVSVKRQDALELLEVMRADLERCAIDTPPAFAFSHTGFFDAAYVAALTARATQLGRFESGAAEEAEQDRLGQLLDEVRLDPSRFTAVLHEAIAAALALEEADRLDGAGGLWGRRSMVERFRRAMGLFDPADLERWLAERGMGPDDLTALSRRWSALEAARRRHAVSVERQLILSLAQSGELASLRRRADEKAARQGSGPTLGDEAVLRQYFDRLGVARPPQLRAWAQEHGWRDAEDLLRALRREWDYVESTVSGPPGS
jgi:hypothetical protein